MFGYAACEEFYLQLRLGPAKSINVLIRPIPTPTCALLRPGGRGRPLEGIFVAVGAAAWSIWGSFDPLDGAPMPRELVVHAHLVQPHQGGRLVLDPNPRKGARGEDGLVERATVALAQRSPVVVLCEVVPLDLPRVHHAPRASDLDGLGGLAPFQLAPHAGDAHELTRRELADGGGRPVVAGVRLTEVLKEAK